jgi:hypothetical protein
MTLLSKIVRCFICNRPATRTVSSFVGTPTTVELCDDCEPYERPAKQ